MSNTKPLTAEDIFNDKSRLVKWPYDMDTEFLDKESAVESMQLYSDRQCIAKDAEIAQLREELANEKYTFMVYRETIDKVLNYHGTEKSESMKKG